MLKVIKPPPFKPLALTIKDYLEMIKEPKKGNQEQDSGRSEWS